jgi:hypothetical protein
MNKMFNIYRKCFIDKDISNQYPFPLWLKKILNNPQTNWQKKNLPVGTNMISGHTHSPLLTRDYLNTGFFDALFGYLSYGTVDNVVMDSKIVEV